MTAAEFWYETSPAAFAALWSAHHTERKAEPMGPDEAIAYFENRRGGQ